MHDPRTEIQHDIEVGQVYNDSRTGDSMVLVYLDSNIYVLRDKHGNHRLGKRREFDTNVGAERFSLSDESGFGETGRLSRVLARADEYEAQGGRKGKHYAEAMREAVSILTDTGSKDAHEVIDFESVDGVGERTASELRNSGYKTRGDVRRANDKELLQVSGIGSGNLQSIRQHVG